MPRILIIEDEPDFVEALDVALSREGHDVLAAYDGRKGLELFRSSRPDLVLLDLMLPRMPGLDVLRRVRSESVVPVIVLSAKDSEADVVAALELGADDYVTKPFSLRELTARIHAAIRRIAPNGEDDGVLAAGGAVLDADRYELRVGEKAFDLPRREFEVMHMLMSRAGRIVRREVMLEEIWGYTWDASKTLDQHIRRLRRKLESVEGAPVIETVRGVGYQYVLGGD